VWFLNSVVYHHFLSTYKKLSFLKKWRLNERTLQLVHIQNLTKRFTKLQCLDIQKLEHNASLIIYKLLKQYLNTKTRQRIIKIEYLKEMLGGKDKYKIFSNFKRDILELAKQELEEKCTIYFDYELIKYGRKYDKIKFFIKERKQETKAQIDYKKIYEEEKLANADELSENYTEKMLDMYELLYGTDPDTRLFNFEADGKPKQLLMKNLISLHFMNDFPDFEKWKAEYIN
jgi:plasmid replication initiation protein